MEASEYANIETLERKHWYYIGKRELVRHWLAALLPLNRAHILLDCGAGTGLFAKEMETQCGVLVLDDHEEALDRLRARFSAEQVLRVSATGIPLPSNYVEAMTALDVLEHIEDDRAAAREFHRVLKPGGVFVATVPASMKLWSGWDETLHHFRRYNRLSFRALFPPNEWELVHVNYTNVLVYPAVWFIRRWRRWENLKEARAKGRSEDRVPPPWLNAVLQWCFVALGKSRIPFPFGVSLILVARKK